MKLFIKITSISLLGLCFLFILIHLLDLNVRKDEIETISRQAMNNTQIIMQENIEDYYYGTNNARLKINNNEEYEQLYKDNLLKLQTTNGQYDLSFKSDYNKGLLSVEINYHYVNFLKQEKIIYKKLTNIIEVVINE